MEEMAISKFKATCLAALEKVRKTGKPIRITKFGDPVADVVPALRRKKKKGWVGSMVGTARIVGDIVSPCGDPEDWDALRS
jgi:prevent-host-death family protein